MSCSLELPVPRQDLRAVLTDFAAYPDFVPWIQRVEVLRVLDGFAPSWELRVQLCVVRPWVLTLLVEQSAPDELRCSLIEGPFASFEGRLSVKEATSPAACTVEVELEVQPGLYAPLSLLRSVQTVELPDLLHRLGERACG